MTLAEIRQTITPENIISILAKYNVHPVIETTNYIIFPTCCHNINGGSPKLYYYKNSTLFKCYTECNSSFDIFELIIKIEKIRNNNDINLYTALTIANINPYEAIDNYLDNSRSQFTIDYMYQFSNAIYNTVRSNIISDEVLNASTFNIEVLSLWEKEGISLSTMKKYKIGYNPIENCITIPIYDENNRLISVRGRYLAEESEVKYKPITFCNKILSAPSSQMLYGLFNTKKAIKNSKTAIIFESEKSVLMMDTCYGQLNNSVATFGKNISSQHILLLKKAGAENIILAYDADYQNEQEFKDKFIEYQKIAKTLAPFFSTAILMDWDHELTYKASPIDCGKEIFEHLLEKKHYVKF